MCIRHNLVQKQAVSPVKFLLEGRFRLVWTTFSFKGTLCKINKNLLAETEGIVYKHAAISA